ncbi:MAG: hypothetical protein LBQ36_02820 [Synergistaceae bacterium]|jgi:hypothetical protein|nr:hypothetical protein [Synergistaceae bacterium]
MDEKYEFRLAGRSDIGEIMSFIGSEWKSDHILAIDRDFFCYQHQVGERVNFLVAINKETGRIDGLEGFIQYSEELLDVAAVMWSVGRSVKTPFLGVRIVSELKSQTKCRSYCGVGANPKTAKPLHEKLLKHHVGVMEHYYRLSDAVNSFKIAEINERTAPPAGLAPATHKLRKLDSFERAECGFDFGRHRGRMPFKDGWYVKRRYFEHPVYRYLVWGVEDPSGDAVSLLVAREAELGAARALRLVDYIGDVGSFGAIGADIGQLIKDGGYEYADIYCAGMDGELLKKAGFAHKGPEDKNIIPNYFDPYVRQNIEIHYASTHEGSIFFKGDGDQDRPNRRVQPN